MLQIIMFLILGLAIFFAISCTMDRIMSRVLSVPEENITTHIRMSFIFIVGLAMGIFMAYSSVFEVN